MAALSSEPDDELEQAPELQHGHVELADQDHSSHRFLYVPDLSSTTGWAAHAVPDPPSRPRLERRPLGFRTR
jgi:hypothetical protein